MKYEIMHKIKALLCLLFFINTTYASNCFYAEFSEPATGSLVFLTDNNIGGANCTGLTEEQTRPIYTCETLTLKTAIASGFSQCAVNGQSTATINILDPSTGTVIVTFNVANTVSSGNCVYAIDFTSLGLATGTYEIQVIINGTIYGDGLANIVDDDSPNIITGITQSNPCNYASDNVCVNINPAFTHSLLSQYTIDWGDGNSDAICPGGPTCSYTICHTYASAGAYTIQLVPTVSSPCPLPTYPIYISHLTASIPGPLSYCANDGLKNVEVTTTGGNPNYTYAWSSAVIQPTGTPGLFTFNTATGNSGIYTVTVTDANGCTATASVNVTIRIDCCDGSNVTCGGHTRSLTYVNVNASQIYADVCGTGNIIDISNFNQGGTVDVRIAINGTLTIDGNYTFRNCTYRTTNLNPTTCSGITFAQGAKVSVPSGKTLTLENSYLFACDNNQWVGIEVASGGSLITQSNASPLGGGRPIIADANVAVNGVSGAIGFINLNNTRFYRDYVGVNIPSATAYTGTINGCTFSYNATDPLQNYMLAPHTNQRTAVGIFANYMGGLLWHINTIGGAANTFERINNGVYAYRSNVQVNNNIFNYIWNYDNINPSSGKAVYAISLTGSQNSIWVQTNSLSSTVAFNNCATAVYLNNVYALVQNNLMVDDTTGIFATACPNTSLDFTNNVITNTFAGITFNGVNSSLVRTVSAHDNNIITVNEPLLQVSPAATYLNPYGIAHFEASNASVSCTGGTTGRECRVLIENNTIYHGRYGIYLNNAYGTRVTYNNVYQTNTVATTGLKAGIYATGCNQPLITQNQLYGNANTYNELGATVSDRRSGVLFFNTTNGELCNNTFTRLGYAMQFQAGCGGTLLKNNHMDATGSNGYRFGVVLKKATTDGVIGAQGTTLLSHGNTFNGSFSGNFQTFTIGSNGSNSPFRIFNYTSPTAQPDPNGSDVGTPITKANASSAAAWQCSTGSGIWKELILNQGDLYSKEIAEGAGAQFMDEGLEESGTWLLEKDLFTRLSQNQSMLNSKALYQNFYDSIQQTSIGDIDRYEEMILSISDTSLVKDSITLEEQIQNVISANNQIQATTEWEQNRKWVNNLYLQTAAKGNTVFSNSEKEALYNLAAQCPYAAGDAVYVARTLYNLIDHNAYFNDEESCTAAALYKKEQLHKSRTNEFSVVVAPNPASNLVDIVVKDSKEDMQLTIYNTLGQIIGKALVNNYVELDVSGFENGVYQLQFTSPAGINYTTRLVVSK